jgi:hypothetical protein
MVNEPTKLSTNAELIIDTNTEIITNRAERENKLKVRDLEYA